MGCAPGSGSSVLLCDSRGALAEWRLCFRTNGVNASPCKTSEQKSLTQRPGPGGTRLHPATGTSNFPLPQMSHDTAQLFKLPSYPTKPGAVSGGQGGPWGPPEPFQRICKVKTTFVTTPRRQRARSHSPSHARARGPFRGCETRSSRAPEGGSRPRLGLSRLCRRCARLREMCVQSHAALPPSSSRKTKLFIHKKTCYRVNARRVFYVSSQC